MRQRGPVVAQTSWLAVSLHLVVAGTLVVASIVAASASGFIMLGAVPYLGYALIARAAVPRAHRRGVALVHRGEFTEAIQCFLRSYGFFTDHAWVDKYRFLTCASASAIGYREMALVNIGFCYSQIQDGTNSRLYYERALAEFPGSAIAQAALNMLSAGERSAGPSKAA